MAWSLVAAGIIGGLAIFVGVVALPAVLFVAWLTDWFRWNGDG